MKELKNTKVLASVRKEYVKLNKTVFEPCFSSETQLICNASHQQPCQGNDEVDRELPKGRLQVDVS